MSKTPTRPGVDPVLADLMARVRILEAANPAAGSDALEVTDGTVDVNPAGILQIGAGPVLTEPVTGTGLLEIPDYQAYTPTVTGSVTDPVFATSGHWVQINKFVHCMIGITYDFPGSLGSGIYDIELPVAGGSGNTVVVGHGWLQHSAAGPTLLRQPVSCVLVPHTGGPVNQWIQLHYPATWPGGTLTAVSDTAPWTWVSSDGMLLSLVYQAA